MGTDISGWVEFSDPEWDAHLDEIAWAAAISTAGILSRNYSLFGSLFGVRNGTSFTPIAAGRGLPIDASKAVTEDAAWEGSFGHTWISLAELDAINWAEIGFDAPTQMKPANGAEWLASQVVKRSIAPSEHEKYLGKKGYIIRVPSITRRDTLGLEGELLLKMAAPLGERFGGDRVRLVVWFQP